QERYEQLLDVRPYCGGEGEAPEGGQADPDEEEERRDPTDEAGGPLEPSRAVPEDPAGQGDADEVQSEGHPEEPARIHGTEPADHGHEDGEEGGQVRPEGEGGCEPQG